MMLIPDDRKHEEEMILARRGGRAGRSLRNAPRHQGRRQIEISLTISPIRNDAGQLVGASKVARDITPQKRAHRELEEADTRKNEFLALLAHD